MKALLSSPLSAETLWTFSYVLTGAYLLFHPPLVDPKSYAVALGGGFVLLLLKAISSESFSLLGFFWPAFLLIAIFSSLWSPIPGISLQSAGFLFLGTILYLMARFNGRVTQSRLETAGILLAAGAALLGLEQWFSGFNELSRLPQQAAGERELVAAAVHNRRAFGPLVTPGALAAVLIFFLPQAWIRARISSGLKRTVFGFLAAVLLAGLLATQSVGAWLSLALAVLAVLIYRRSWKGALVVLGLGLAVGTAMVWQRGFGSWHLAAFSMRLQLWGSAWELFLKHPFFGSGFGTFDEAYRQAGFSLDTGARFAHNLLLQVLVETGGVGFLLFFLSFFGFLRRLKAPPLWEGWGVMTGMAALLLFSLVDLPFQMPEIVWWVAAILGRLELRAARVPKLPSLPAAWVEWGLLTVLLVSGFWPPFRPWNFALLAGTLWVLLALSRAAFEKLPLWVFAGGAFLALRAFTSPSASGAVRFLETAGLVLAFYLWLPGLENPKAFLKRFLLLGVIWGIEAWVFSSLGYPFENWTGFPNPKHLAVFLIPLFFVFFDFPSKAFRWSRLLASLFALATLVRLRATGALLGLAGGTFFHPGLSKTRKMLFAGVLILGALGVHALQKSSTQWDRGMIWKTSLQVWGLHPFFGSGPGVFAGEFHKVKEPVPGGISRYLMDAEYSHNELLDFLAAFGLAGMVFLIGLAGAGWRKNRTKEKPAEGGQDARAALAGMGVASFLDFCFHTPLVVLQAAGLLAREKRQTKGFSGTAAFLTLGIVGGLFGAAAFVPHLREQAKELESRQKFPEALRRLEAAERLNAWDARPAWEKARFLEKLYLATGDPTWRRKADEALARAMDLERAGGEGAWDKARLLTARALRDRSGESFRAAVQAWDAAAKALPYSAFLRSEQGSFFLRAGQKEGALQCFQKAVDLEPNDAGAWVNVGNLRRERGEETGAEEAYRRAWEIYNQWKGTEGISPLEKRLVDLPPPVLEFLRKETGS